MYMLMFNKLPNWFLSNRCGGMNVAQKTQTITRLPQFFAIHKIGGTCTDMQHAVQVNNMSGKILRYLYIEKTPSEDFPDTNFDLRPAQEYVLLIIV